MINYGLSRVFRDIDDFINYYFSTLPQSALYLVLPFNVKSSNYRSNLITKIVTLPASLKPKFIKTSLILLSQLAISSSTYAILTATSSHVITGNAPQVVALLSANKHGFAVNGVFYSEASDTLKSDEVKEFDGNLTLNDFKVANYTSTDLDRFDNYRDLDGDYADPQQPFKVDSTYYWWYDNSGKRITGADIRKAIGCGSGFSMPLKLIIQSKVKTYSEYGIPKESEQLILSKTYQIAAKSELCYAKPNSAIIYPEHQWGKLGDNPNLNYRMYWNSPDGRTRSKGGGGYTQDYVPDYGFKAVTHVSGGRNFPTTGFPGAKFQLVMAGAQTDYRYQIINNPGGGVSIDENGMVKLTSKPTGTVTVKAILKRNPSVSYDYSFNPTSIWAIPQGDIKGVYDTAVKRCGGSNNVVGRYELTNAPFTSRDDDPAIFLGGILTRAIDGSLFSEWGFINQKAYPDSQWRGGVYWTRDRSSYSTRQYHIYADSGHVGEGDDSWNNYIACKG
ncbi:hypothetical protein [Gilliamella sp. Pas-s25]|uniref:hypothetical protein n=1 Tax=Gilliamella sp. Pas-s25 TaxID=2687310 RepID=UPI00135EDFDF|nr:hypothetical protein [Gilliamella sp. Pas-s25]MWP63040.1 hypothetical protein [Gilliamella sp. Pas-s25]